MSAAGEGAPSVVPMAADHWPAVSRIYTAGIATGHATFEDRPPTWEQFDATRPAGRRWVAVDGGGAVLGWVAASAVSDRCAYSGVVEHSVYVAPVVQGRGIGRLLLAHLARATDDAGVWTTQSGVFPENVASLRLHEAAGFETVGVRRRLGRMTYGPMAGRWRDVVLIERRSTTVGID